MSTLWRRGIQSPVAAVMAAYYLLTAIVSPIIKPIVRGLVKLRLIQTLRERIDRLGPYPSLLLLAVPVVVIEPLKIGALAILGSGRIVLGTISLIASHGLSLIIIERLFEAVKPKLLTMRWFAVTWGWFADLRDQILAWLHSTWAWSIVLRVRDTARAAAAKIVMAIGRSHGRDQER